MCIQRVLQESREANFFIRVGSDMIVSYWAKEHQAKKYLEKSAIIIKKIKGNENVRHEV